MDTGYEVEPERIGRRAGRRRPLLASVIALAVVTVLLVKPWAGPETHELAAGPDPATASAPTSVSAASPAPDRPVVIAPALAPDPTWPAAAGPTASATETAQQADVARGWLARRAGTWGIGDAGTGPRILRDEPWSDWTPVAIEVVDGGPIHVATWPRTDLCAGIPRINDRPTLVALTTPDDIGRDLALRGWWTDGQRVMALEGSVAQASTSASGITYLERVDKAKWPPGRYEFLLVAGEQTVSLTVCLTRIA